jgi:hypothetical protein
MTRCQQDSRGLRQRRQAYRDPARGREMDPALPALVADVYGHQLEIFLIGDAVEAVTYDRLVDVVRRDQRQRHRCALEVGLEAGRVQQAEGYVQVLAEGPIPVTVYLPRG